MAAEFYKKIKSLHELNLTDEEKKILVHCCCAVCFGYPSQYLKMLGYIPIAYFYNPNIHPKEEFTRRRDELRKYCEKYNFEYFEENCVPEEFYNCAKGLEEEPEKGKRCNECFYLRLAKTAKKAKELNIKQFTTTLTVSPHKVSKNVFEAGKKAEKLEKVEFKEFDFKKHDGFKITQQIAQFNKMYKQTYCGCEFSIRKPVENMAETEV